MKSVLQILNLIGGLGIFLIGMRIMSDGVQRRAGNRLKSVLHTMTENRFAGVLTGLGVTSVIQSSSATTVLLVSLVNAGLVTLKQSLGVVMGANIGTTLTAWIVSLLGFKFKITNLALPAVAVAIPLYFSKIQKRREYGDILIGFGLLFLGLSFMKESVPDIRSNPEVLSFLQNWSEWGYGSVFLFILAGTLLTIIVQSSSAAMTITITMAFKGWISFPIAAAVVLGENIGTTITALLASLPMNTAARRTARAHMVFNFIGVFWMLLVFFPFTRLVDAIVPGSVDDPEKIPVHLAMFHTLFNISNTLLLIPFVGPLAKLVKKLVSKREEEAPEKYRLALVPSNLPDALESNLITVRGELSKMAGRATDMLELVMKAARKPEATAKIGTSLTTMEQEVDDMQEEITLFLTRSIAFPVSEEQARNISAQQRMAHEIESIADSCFSISLLLDRLHKKGRRLHEEADEELYAYTVQVLDFLEYNRDFLDRKFNELDLEVAQKMDREIDKVRNKLRKRSRKTIEQDADVDVKGELIFIDIVRHLEHIGDNSINVSEAAGELA